MVSVIRESLSGLFTSQQNLEFQLNNNLKTISQLGEKYTFSESRHIYRASAPQNFESDGTPKIYNIDGVPAPVWYALDSIVAKQYCEETNRAGECAIFEYQVNDEFEGRQIVFLNLTGSYANQTTSGQNVYYLNVPLMESLCGAIFNRLRTENDPLVPKEPDFRSAFGLTKDKHRGMLSDLPSHNYFLAAQLEKLIPENLKSRYIVAGYYHDNILNWDPDDTKNTNETHKIAEFVVFPSVATNPQIINCVNKIGRKLVTNSADSKSSPHATSLRTKRKSSPHATSLIIKRKKGGRKKTKRRKSIKS
jgi:hypothetical protein